MALSRKVKDRIFRNKLRKQYRYPAKVTVTETDVSSFRPYQRDAAAAYSRMPMLFLYSSKGPSHGRV